MTKLELYLIFFMYLECWNTLHKLYIKTAILLKCFFVICNGILTAHEVEGLYYAAFL